MRLGGFNFRLLPFAYINTKRAVMADSVCKRRLLTSAFRLLPSAYSIARGKMRNYKLITYEQAKSPIAEAYRTLRTNLQFSRADGSLQTLMFTSAGPGEGKSTTVANSAVVLAQAGKRVIIVDCDLRKPVQHKIFGLPNRGVTNVLIENLPATEVLQDTEIRNLRVLTSGPIPPNPSELLGSAKMERLLSELKDAADYLIIDAPPVVAVTDACVLASKMDGVLLTVAAGMVRPEMGQRAKDLLVKANAPLLGVVLNRVEIEKEHAYYYYYYGNDGVKHKSSRKKRAKYLE
jgi:capsular exopolysaccharide synthesis family protein